MRNSAAAMKSSKTFCLLCFMPAWCQSLAVFAAAAEVGDGVNATHLEPGDGGRREAGLEADVESAVAVEEGRVPAVAGEVLAGHDEELHWSAILARAVADLGLVGIGVELEIGLLEHRAPAGGEIVAVADRRGGVGGERVEGLHVVRLAVEAPRGAGARKIERAERLALEVVEVDAGPGIGHGVGDEAVGRRR